MPSRSGEFPLRLRISGLVRRTQKLGSANGNRTRISALKGPRANRCTIAPQSWELQPFQYTRKPVSAPRGAIVAIGSVSTLPSSGARNVQLSGCARCEKITAGVKRGISTGMNAHHSRGFPVRKTAATSMAHTKQMRMAILRTHERSGRICIKISPRESTLYFIATL